jgi:hypothetical protein
MSTLALEEYEHIPSTPSALAALVFSPEDMKKISWHERKFGGKIVGDDDDDD